MTKRPIITSAIHSIMVAKHKKKYYWCVQHWGKDILDDSIRNDIKNYDEIPKSLYDELIKLGDLYIESMFSNH